MTVESTNGTKRRKDAILDEATRLFAERGYAACSMADLAECVGLRKASLFHHFPSKDDLYGAVLERLMRSLSDTITASLTPAGTWPEKLDRMSDGIVAAFGAQPFAARIVSREMMDWGPFIRGRYGELVAPVLKSSEEFLSAGMQANAFKQRDIHQLILSLLALHVMPFAIGDMVKSMSTVDPASPEFLATRREAVREHVRALVLTATN
jgi:AcrR family transcriptional regulator